MVVIERLSELIDEELEDAEKYIKCAIKHDLDAELSDIFLNLSKQEMHHVEMLHRQVIRLINEYKAEGKKVPEDMLRVYEYLHSKHIEKADAVKSLIETYTGQ